MNSPSLNAYMAYTAEDARNLFRFVEHGGRLVDPEDLASLTRGRADLRAKIDTLQAAFPRLGRQLAFLLDFLAVGTLRTPAGGPDSLQTVRQESAFALLYASRETGQPAHAHDFVNPSDSPDEAAVAETVLERHAEFFQWHCAAAGLDWEPLQPQPAA